MDRGDLAGRCELRDVNLQLQGHADLDDTRRRVFADVRTDQEFVDPVRALGHTGSEVLTVVGGEDGAAHPKTRQGHRAGQPFDEHISSVLWRNGQRFVFVHAMHVLNLIRGEIPTRRTRLRAGRVIGRGDVFRPSPVVTRPRAARRQAASENLTRPDWSSFTNRVHGPGNEKGHAAQACCPDRVALIF